MPRRVHIEALRRAERIVGGRPQLGTYLKVSVVSLALWMSGATATPPDVFLKAVDLISECELPDDSKL